MGRAADVGKTKRNFDGGMTRPEFGGKRGAERRKSIDGSVANDLDRKKQRRDKDNQAPNDQPIPPGVVQASDSSASTGSRAASSDCGIIRISEPFTLPFP